MDNFTLIIPTHNRHQYLGRSIEYFQSLNANVIYCDSSIQPYNIPLPSNIEYIHLPNKSFSEKILITIDKINTSFVALCADDDFILLDSLYKGCDILNKNTNFATIHGNSIEFLKEFDCNFHANHIFTEDNLSGSTEEKVIKLFSEYRQLLWGMYKKNILMDTFEIINRANFKNDNFYEMVLGVIAADNGDIKFLEDVWSVREYSQDSHWAIRHKALYYYKQDKDIKSDIKTYINLVNQFTKNGIGELALDNYLKMSFSLKISFFIKYYINNILPNWLIAFGKIKNRQKRYSKKINYKVLPELIIISNLLKKAYVKSN